MKLAWFLASFPLALTLATGTAAAQDDFDLGKTVAVCTTCHGEEGLPVTTDIPILWGQQFYYLYVQLKDYKAGRRANDIMETIAADFDKKQMKALAKYFSEKPWPRITITKDSDLARRGRAEAGAGECPQCHNKYMGDSRVPRVAGQNEDYLRRTMLEFKNKVRLNSPSKSSLMKSFGDEEIKDIAHFLATL